MLQGKTFKIKKFCAANSSFFRIESIVELDFDIICTIRDPIASHSSYVKI